MWGGGVFAALDLEHIAAVAFVDIALIVVVARAMGMLFKRIGQPAVVGEILAGIALGPSLLGLLPGDLPERVFPLEVRPFLAIIAQLGLVIFMFIVGLELDPKLVRGKERLAAVISLSSVALPFVSGIGAAALLFDAHNRVDGEEVSFTAFALFIGASMSVTAFPVLARILTERGMHRTQLGVLVLACAAVDDVLAWSLLAVVVAVAASASAIDVPLVMIEAVGFVAVMFLVVRPQLARLADRYRQHGELTPNMVAVVLVGILVSSYLTSIIGIHAIFGAFVFGVVMPREDTVQLFHDLLGRFEQLVVLLLLPVFFIVTGLSVDIRGLGLANVPELLLIIAVACFGKFGGATLAARALKIRPRRAASIGILMNTRGLTELVILTIGLELGILDEQLFTMLVIMAIFTTIITTPLLKVVYPDRLVARDVAEAEGSTDDDVFRVVVKLSAPTEEKALAALGIAGVGGERPAEVVLTRLLGHHDRNELTGGIGFDLVTMTEAMSELRTLAAEVEVNGVNVAVRAQFAGDPTAELRAQIRDGGSEILFALAGDDTIVGLLDDPPCVVALVDPGAPAVGAQTTVAVIVDEGLRGATAASVAIRLVSGGTSSLVLVPGRSRRAERRTETIVELVHQAGMHCTVAEEPPEGSTIVSGFAHGSAPTHITVVPPRDYPSDCIEHLLEQRIEARSSTPGIPPLDPVGPDQPEPLDRSIS